MSFFKKLSTIFKSNEPTPKNVMITLEANLTLAFDHIISECAKEECYYVLDMVDNDKRICQILHPYKLDPIKYRTAEFSFILIIPFDEGFIDGIRAHNKFKELTNFVDYEEIVVDEIFDRPAEHKRLIDNLTVYKQEFKHHTPELLENTLTLIRDVFDVVEEENIKLRIDFDDTTTKNIPPNYVPWRK